MPLLGPNGQPLSEAPPAGAEPVPESGPVQCVTAFIAYQTPDGKWSLSDDLNIPLVPSRKPHNDDYTAGCSVVLRDVQTHEMANVVIPNTAQMVVNAQMQMAQQAREQFETAQVRAKMEAEKVRAARR